jgi:hypothetical protein
MGLAFLKLAYISVGARFYVFEITYRMAKVEGHFRSLDDVGMN